jgi:hypothetical protein
MNLSVTPGDADQRAHVRMAFVDSRRVARAIVAATSLAGALDLQVRDTVVIHNSNTLSLRLLPCDVFARTALVGQDVAAFEVQVAQALGAVTAPIASLDPRVEPRAYQRDGFAVTFWTYYRSVADRGSPLAYAHALHRLHAGCETSALRHRTTPNESQPLSVS